MTRSEFVKELQTSRENLFRYSMKLTRDYQDAQDLFQEAAAKAFRFRTRFQTGTNFPAWMSTIIRNTYINHYRLKKNKVVREPIESFTFAIENQNVISNEGEVNLRIREVLGMLDQMDDMYRLPFLMHYQGYEYQEIGEHLDLPMGTVKSRLFYARKKMKQMMRTRA